MPGSIVYTGPSLLDQAPIVAIAVWARVPSEANSKTGDVVQTYIMRSDLHPIDASRTGKDYSICGGCQHRGTPTLGRDTGQAENRSCYVQLHQGPSVVYKSFIAGKYPAATDAYSRAAVGRNRVVRIGSYGEGAVVPAHVWRELISEAEGHTAYSHMHANSRVTFDPATYMASVDSLPEAQTAWAKGYRTFRVIAAPSEITPREIICPSERVSCADCQLCNGAHPTAKNIAIVVHGTGKKHFTDWSKS